MHKLNLSNQQSTPEENKTQLDDSGAERNNQDSRMPTAPEAQADEQATQAHITPKQKASMKQMPPKKLAMLAMVAIVAGIATGFGGHQLSVRSATDDVVDGKQVQSEVEGEIKAGDVFGSADEKTFKDSAEGYLEAGGLDGEGSNSLLRPGGASQTVYLTSSVMNLDDFVGMEVKVWGETFKGQKAGWLMDVGRVEVVDTEGSVPTEQ